MTPQEALEVDNMLFQLEMKLSQLCDKKSKVSYKDISEQIMNVRIEIRKKYGKSQ